MEKVVIFFIAAIFVGIIFSAVHSVNHPCDQQLRYMTANELKECGFANSSLLRS